MIKKLILFCVGENRHTQSFYIYTLYLENLIYKMNHFIRALFFYNIFLA